MEASGAADDEPGLAGDDKLRRGVRALEDVGPRPGETLKEWAARIGTGCGWLEEHSKPLRAELTRMVGVWVERGYVLKNTPPRLTYTHCREVMLRGSTPSARWCSARCATAGSATCMRSPR